MITNNRTIKWIESLADQELLIKAGERTSIDICATKDEVLGVETATFLRDLFHHFEYLVQIFNFRVGKPELQVKLSRNGDPQKGFSLQRNMMKLHLLSPQPGTVTLQCAKDLRDELGALRPSVMFTGLIEANFGTFHDVEWQFLGNRVVAEQVARHHITEFIQVSRSHLDN